MVGITDIHKVKFKDASNISLLYSVCFSFLPMSLCLEAMFNCCMIHKGQWSISNASKMVNSVA